MYVRQMGAKTHWFSILFPRTYVPNVHVCPKSITILWYFGGEGKITLITHDFPLLTYVYSYGIRNKEANTRENFQQGKRNLCTQSKPRIKNGEELMSFTVYTSSHIILVIYIKWILRRYVPRWWWPQVAAIDTKKEKFRKVKCV